MITFYTYEERDAMGLPPAPPRYNRDCGGNPYLVRERLFVFLLKRRSEWKSGRFSWRENIPDPQRTIRGGRLVGPRRRARRYLFLASGAIEMGTTKTRARGQRAVPGLGMPKPVQPRDAVVTSAVLRYYDPARCLNQTGRRQEAMFVWNQSLDLATIRVVLAPAHAGLGVRNGIVEPSSHSIERRAIVVQSCRDKDFIMVAGRSLAIGTEANPPRKSL
ncbi:hypothetical protein FB45DRAFT_1004195 [Roridomyces roridus]|uniref:Uncharacterized protein n=1 Tax=Roridomyces roridus TaxID=1738132 RepID=A0AAD7BRH5_9AGAR|nr:hypothetical protein FB45DRAFT_1004195 [Roridomyces roridus]